MDIFQILFYQPTFNLLIVLSNIFGNLGWAIIVIALLAKVLTIPLTRNQIKNAEKTGQLQIKMKELRTKYKSNEKKLAEEMAKLQASALPGQLGGCLSVIIFLILFLQIRGAILDLVNRGYVAFDQVSYATTLNKKEDFVKLNLPGGFSSGNHDLALNITTDNGNYLSEDYNFWVTDNTDAKNQKVTELKDAFNALNDTQKQATLDAITKIADAQRAADIGVYNKSFDAAKVSVPLSQFLIFVTQSEPTYIFTDNAPDLTFYLRPPSNQNIDYSKLNVMLDGQNITKAATWQQGDKLNLDFAGTNLSRVATDFGIFNFAVTWPYILIALISAITQYFVTKLYSANAQVAETVETKKEDKDGKPNVHKDGDEEPDFTQVMAQSSKQMNLIFPVMTMMMSLGYLGGASFIPMGVTLFWTAQNSFVIIQQMISQRQRIAKQLRAKWADFQGRTKRNPASK